MGVRVGSIVDDKGVYQVLMIPIVFVVAALSLATIEPNLNKSKIRPILGVSAIISVVSGGWYYLILQGF